MSVHIQLEQFEGPMGLLLYLIRKEEMNIYDIQIHRITSQYLDYVKNMKELDLEGAGEFVQMASSLLLIKSRMLLPHTDQKGEEVENEDPRKELIRRLVEYEKFREASKQLGKRPLLNRDVFARGTREDFDALEDLVTVDDGGLFQMISLYRSLLKKVNSGVHQVTQKFQTIASRILELKGRLLVGQRIELNELLSTSEKHRDKLLITFLSMLELARLQLVSLFQAEAYGALHIDPKLNFDESIVTHVQEYDAGVASAAPAPETLVAAVEVVSEETNNLAGLTEEDFLKAIADGRGEEEPKPALVESIADMATDDDILAAERELGLIPDVAPRAENEVAVPEASIDTDVSVEAVASEEGVASESPAPEELHFELDLSRDPVLPGLTASPKLFALPDPEDFVHQELNLNEQGDDWARIDQSLKRIEHQLDRMDWSEKSLHALGDVSSLLAEDEAISETVNPDMPSSTTEANSEEIELKSKESEKGSDPEPSQEI